MTNPTAEQARKEERDAIVAWLWARESVYLTAKPAWPFTKDKSSLRELEVQAFTTRNFADAIQRGAHREQPHD